MASADQATVTSAEQATFSTGQPSGQPRLPCMADVERAAQRISPHLHRTPVLTSRLLSEQAGVELFFKCDNMQKCGSFKPRGAVNSVMALSEEDARKGVVTHSSGNFGQSMAWAASLRGIPAYVVMPSNSPQAKQSAVVAYGGVKVLCEPNLAARESTCAQVQAQHGAIMLHPFNRFETIAGQGTVATELIEQVADMTAGGNLDALIAPIGGGGLMSGVSIVGRARGIRCFGAEPEMADDAWQSLHAGKLIPQTNPRTIADGMRTSLGDLTFDLISQNVEEIVTVSEKEIASAMRLAYERLKVVIEPSSATVLAAVFSPKFVALRDAPGRPPLRRVGLILSGGNVDVSQLSALFAVADQ